MKRSPIVREVHTNGLGYLLSTSQLFCVHTSDIAGVSGDILIHAGREAIYRLGADGRYQFIDWVKDLTWGELSSIRRTMRCKECRRTIETIWERGNS